MEMFVYRDENLEAAADGAKRIVLDEEEHFHLSRVLRIRKGERLLATNGAGAAYLCEVTEIGRDRTVCSVIESNPGLNGPKRKFCIGISVLKPVSKLEFAVEKCTEIGASGFVVFRSARSEKSGIKSDRLRSIVKAAVKQSLQSRFPQISEAENLREILSFAEGYETRLVLHEKSSESLKWPLPGVSDTASVLALVGPEGGFSEEEISFLKENGFAELSLGKSRLRSETAAIKIASLLSTY